MDIVYHALKKDLLLTAKTAYEQKLMAGTSGNMSVFLPEKGHMIITPSSYSYEMMEEKDLVVIDLDGNRIEGIHNPSSEWRMHAKIYKDIPRIKAVVHTHSPYATSFAVVQKEIPVILIEMGPFLKGKVEVSPYAAQGSEEVGINAVPILMRKNACLLANHGAVTVGKSIAEAYVNSVYLEDSAKIYHMACAVGTPIVIEE